MINKINNTSLKLPILLITLSIALILLGASLTNIILPTIFRGYYENKEFESSYSQKQSECMSSDNRNINEWNINECGVMIARYPENELADNLYSNSNSISIALVIPGIILFFSGIVMIIKRLKAKKLIGNSL